MMLPGLCNESYFSGCNFFMYIVTAAGGGIDERKIDAGGPQLSIF